MGKYYVYTLLSLKDWKLYTGFTINLKQRLQRHARGEVISTKSRLPLKLIHYEYFNQKEDAQAREVFLKSGFGRKQLKLSLKKTFRAAREFSASGGKIKSVMLSGGVSVNKLLRDTMEQNAKELKINFLAPEFQFIADNAAMIAVAAYIGILSKKKKLSTEAQSELTV